MRLPERPLRRRPRLRLREAVALGALHGPAELLPISSSAHTELVPWLLGWEYERLDGELRKAFEVALHAGTAAALLLALREDVGAALRRLDRRRLGLVAASAVPTGVIGLALERPVERRLAGPVPIAAGLLAGAAAMAWADRVGPAHRRARDATLGDALVLGANQALALVPGVSRNGITLAAARMRGFAPADAGLISRHMALPVIAGAAALKGSRLARRGLPPAAARGFAGGIAASFATTLASSRLVRDERRLAPYAAYRAALACAVLIRAERARRAGPGRRGSARHA